MWPFEIVSREFYAAGGISGGAVFARASSIGLSLWRSAGITTPTKSSHTMPATGQTIASRLAGEQRLKLSLRHPGCPLPLLALFPCDAVFLERILV